MLTAFSWTAITWFFVVGSIVVMLIWIGIYSLFNSVDFNDEIVVLFGTVGFWVTVVLSTVIALGTVYRPHNLHLLTPRRSTLSWPIH